MLYINDKQYDVYNKLLQVKKIIYNGIDKYEVELELGFKYSNNDGHLNLSFGLEDSPDKELFLNKTYKGIPYDEGLINFFEIYDTFNFYASEIESEITIILKKNKHGKVLINVCLDDKFLKINYKDEIDIV